MKSPALKKQNSDNPAGDMQARAFQAADALRKKFGDPLTVITSNSQRQPMNMWHSGSLSLDLAIGGGIPEGRILEYYGGEASGKCVSGGTYCLTENGLMTVSELFEHNGLNPSNTIKVVEHSFGLVNEKAQLENTSHFTWNSKKPIKRLLTSIGQNIEATHNHRLRVLNSDGHIVWRTAGDIMVGDTMVTMRGTNQFGYGELTTDEASYIGYLIADGSLSNKNRVLFSNSDKDVIEEYNRIASSMVNTPIRVYAKEKTATIDHHINNKGFRELLFEKYGLDYTVASGKQVPLCVRTAGKDAQIAFLQSYIELECSIDFNKSTIEVSSASKKLLEQVQLMLLNLGIVSLLREKIVNGDTYYRLFISSLDYDKYGDIIGFKTSARQKVYEMHVQKTQTQTNFDSIPNMGKLLRSLYDSMDTTRDSGDIFGDYMGDSPRARLTYDRLARIINHCEHGERNLGENQQWILGYLKSIFWNNYLFVDVVGVEQDETITFDVVMPETHSFWSNGLISHNTTLALAAAGQVLSRGEVVLFVDAEHAFNPDWAKLMGVDINNPNFILAQPETAEMALEILQEFLRMKAIRMAIVDSVAALIPSSQLSGEIGEASVGLVARLMSQELRKIAVLCSSQKATCIFINQLRANIKMGMGAGYGDPNTTTGGNALKFYASLRVDIRRIQTIKQDGVSTANRVKATVKKNKVGVPYKSAEFDIDFRRGISILGEIIDISTQLGFLDKKGAFYRYDGEMIGQGRESVRNYLRDNQDLAFELHNKILTHFSLPVLTAQPSYEGVTLQTGSNTFGATDDITAEDVDGAVEEDNLEE